jgi:transposase
MERNSRHELTDHQWKLIEPLLPKGKKRGRPLADPRLLTKVAGQQSFFVEIFVEEQIFWIVMGKSVRLVG